MGIRRQAREAAVQALYMCDISSDWTPEQANSFFVYFPVPELVQSYAARLCAGVLEEKTQIDSYLTCASENWSISRMSRVDRSILRMAAYEIICLGDIPNSVAINEAIELAKCFASDESSTFVNGVLDKVASTAEGDAKGGETYGAEKRMIA